MNSCNIEYHDYKIKITYKGYINCIPFSFYETQFIVRNRKTNKAFGLLCRVSQMQIEGGGEYAGILPKEKVPDILKELGLQKVRKLIDSPQFEFENNDEYIGYVEFVAYDEMCAPVFKIEELTKG